MKFRVYFVFNKGGVYYSEWFDTLGEADKFVQDAEASGALASRPWVEDEDGNHY